MQKLKLFLRNNQFALIIAGGWLALTWMLVLGSQLLQHMPLSLAGWGGNWDGAWYRSIVEHGYDTLSPPVAQTNLAFFPLLPMLTWLLKTITFLPVVWAGMVVSSVAFAAALVVLYKLVDWRFGDHIARWTLILLAFNPFSYYFGMMYTESLCLLTAAVAFWFIYKKQWWWAALAAGLATSARSVGVGVALAVVVAWIWQAKRRDAAFWVKTAGIIVLSFAGVALFALYEWQHTGDFLAYAHSQKFWPGRGGPNNIGNEIAYLWAHKVVNKEYLITLMWYIATVLGFIGLWLLVRLREWLMVLFAAVALSLPLLFGTAGAMNRYVQVVFPIFIAYGAWMRQRPQWFKTVLVALFALLLAADIFVTVGSQHIFLG